MPLLHAGIGDCCRYFGARFGVAGWMHVDEGEKWEIQKDVLPTSTAYEAERAEWILNAWTWRRDNRHEYGTMPEITMEQMAFECPIVVLDAMCTGALEERWLPGGS